MRLSTKPASALVGSCEGLGFGFWGLGSEAFEDFNVKACNSEFCGGGGSCSGCYVTLGLKQERRATLPEAENPTFLGPVYKPFSATGRV